MQQRIHPTRDGSEMHETCHEVDEANRGGVSNVSTETGDQHQQSPG